MAVTQAIKCDADHMFVAIYNDDKCSDMNAYQTSQSKLTDEDKKGFNKCHEMKVGNKKRYMKNICLELSFNIQFFSDENCTVELEETSDFKTLYTYEWDKCYKRSDKEYMIIENPFTSAMNARMKEKQAQKPDAKPGPVSYATGLQTVAAVSTMALAITSSF